MPSKEPEYSCPSLDAAIAEIEDARKIHEKIRNWGHEWKDAYRELEDEHSEAIDDKNSEISDLKAEVSELKREIRQLENQLAAQ